jgi:FtsP/CotA-like multicopper oxidase with cupredoxin domain
MDHDTSRRGFLVTGGATAGLAAAADADTATAFPRYHAGAGGPVGSPTDRGKLVPGQRQPGLPPVLVETPDLPANLPHRLVGGVKEFHLTAQPVKRELLPGLYSNHWGFNGTMPGPTIQVTEGDRVRIVLHNELPEPTSLHLHGLELDNRVDGVPFVVMDPVTPKGTRAYEFHLHQEGTFFYHAHFPMQEAIGMVGLVIAHPRKAYEPAVDQDFALISQEFVIRPASNTPDTTGMDFNFLTFNGRCGPYITPLVCKLGNRVRVRIINFSTADHHPIHLHGHTFWVTGTEGGRIPESAWIPGNNVLVGVAQVREFEFVANNPGDWVMHCHMFHHMMNHMVSGVGPGSRGMAKAGGEDPRYRVPAFPQGTGMMAMLTPEQVKKVTSNPRTRGMRADWYMGVHGLFTVVRVLPEELYDKVISGKGHVPPGASVPGGDAGGAMPGMKMPGMKMPK